MTKRPNVTISEPALALEIANAAQRIAFPGARTLGDLFARWQVRIPDYSKSSNERPEPAHVWRTRDYSLTAAKWYTGRAELSSTCVVWGAPGNLYDVQPRPEVLEDITRNMLIADRYTLSFQITIRKAAGTANTALVHCGYNLISGGRWLAIVPVASLPAELWGAP